MRFVLPALLLVLCSSSVANDTVAPISFATGATLFLVPSRADAAALEVLAAQRRQCESTTTTMAAADACRLRALIATSYAKDPAASVVALQLYDQTGTVAGLLPGLDMDGAYRGILRLEPVLPIGRHRRHLQFAADALFEFDDFFRRLQATTTTTTTTTKELAFRWRPLGLRFFESVKRKTPSAFAVDWTVSYNVRGSLFTSPQRVKETFFHEIFHLNDQTHDHWSPRALSSIYDAIVARCGMKTACLTPWAPDGIKVIGGTYYAFMPDNGVSEYAADLAKRWYIEQRAVLHGQKVAAPFKCGPAENAVAWQLLIDEFFAGIDHVPACR